MKTTQVATTIVVLGLCLMGFAFGAGLICRCLAEAFSIGWRLVGVAP